MNTKQPIGVFDSGYGGLTILKDMVELLPHYDYIYLGDNARAPYGTRSFKTVYEYTLQCVKWLFNQGCPLVILACNTASAKALRTIQQRDLANIDPTKRVLGVIRPTAEVIGGYSQSGSVGILATKGTVASESYLIEIRKFFPNVKVYQEACPIWVPLVEYNEHHSKGTDFFVKKHIDHLLHQAPAIDTFLLACTHYPLLKDKIREYTPADIKIISQGSIVAGSLSDYLIRHPEMESRLSHGETVEFFTTDSSSDFDEKATLFYGKHVNSVHVNM